MLVALLEKGDLPPPFGGSGLGGGKKPEDVKPGGKRKESSSCLSGKKVNA